MKGENGEGMDVDVDVDFCGDLASLYIFCAPHTGPLCFEDEDITRIIE